ncbi:MAG: hypothetical protein QW434_06735 [Pyrobaculum sp.]
MLLRLVLLTSLAVLAAASAQQQVVEKPLLICIDAGKAGLAGKPPLIAGYVTSRGARQPAQLYINGTVIKAVGIWEVNSTKPQIQNLTVLPPEVRGLVCFQPGDPAPAGRGLYIEVEARGRRYGVTIINATENPTAPPALPLEYIADKVELVRGRLVAKRAVRGPTAHTAQAEPLAIITPGPSLFRDFSGSIVAIFKLNRTDNYVLNLNGAGEACATGRFILPNGTSSFSIIFTPATRANVYGGAYYLTLSIAYKVYDEGNRLLYNNTINVQVPNNPKPWYIVNIDLSNVNNAYNIVKRIELSICKPARLYVYGQYVIDAYIYSIVAARSYAQPFAMESPGQDAVVAPPPSAGQLFNGTYIVVPGFTPPPGYVLGSARANIVLRTCASNAPTSVNIYWGPFYIGAISRTQGIDGCWYYVVTPVMFTGAFNTAATSSLRLGGLIHSIAIGPFPWDVYNRGITVQQMRIEGLYRPEMNARSSRAFNENYMGWGTYTLSGFTSFVDYYSGAIYYYGSKVDLKLYATGDAYYEPHLVISISKYDGMQYHCPTVEITIGASSNGVPVALERPTSFGSYTEGGSGVLSFVDLIVDFVSNVFDETNKWVSRALGFISWVTFGIDVVQAASWVGVNVDQVNGELRYTIGLGPLAPGKVVIDGGEIFARISSGSPVTFIIKQVKMCGVTYGDYSAYLDPTARSMSNSNIHFFRTFTCGKQEIFPMPMTARLCDASFYG